jgi:hypothetical protein
MGTVANLSVKIGANTQDFNAGLNKLTGEVQGVSSRLAAAGAVIAGAFSLNAIGGALNDVIEKTSRIADGAARIGVSAEAFQRLSFAAQQSGGSMSAIETSMRVMADRLTDGKLPAALTQMGLSIETLRGMAPDQAFLTIANAVAGIPDPMLQSATAVDIFGRGAQAILPAIKLGFADIAAQAPVMSNAMIASADQMGDKVSEMHLKLDNLRAQALLPLVNGFLQLPESLQIFGAGIVSFLPVLEPLLLAMIALGGPGKAIAMVTTGFATLGTFLTASLPAAFAVVVTFFTTTLPTAIGAVIAFLGPQGLIALGLLALAAIWYKWGDDIKAYLAPWAAKVAGFFLDVKNKAVAYAQQLFEGVKAWLVDKFNAIVEQIRQKVGMVTGFFKDMYMKVVGGSFVPDMVNGIGQWFGQLAGKMVDPTATATTSVTGLFQTMADSVSSTIDGLLAKIPVIGGALSDIFNSIGGLGGILGKIPGLGGLFGGATGGGSGVLMSAGGGIGGGAGAGAGFSLAGGLFGLGASLLPMGIQALSNKLKGGEEGMLVNPARDAYTAGLRAEYGGADGYEGLVNALAAGGAHGDAASGLIRVLQNADTMAAFNSAVAAIDRVIASDGGGSGAGGGTFNVNFSVSAIDGQNVSEFVESDNFTTAFIDALRRNRNGILTASQDLIGAEG